jgi:hypothetical protein
LIIVQHIFLFLVIALIAMPVQTAAVRAQTIAPARAVLIVSSAADSGENTLRAAIEIANASAEPDRIVFALANGASQITLRTPLPVIEQALTIDGSTQPGYAGVPVITLDGAGRVSNALVFAEGPASAASGSTVSGLTISGFSGTALTLIGRGPYAIQRNAFGSPVAPNAYRDVHISASNSVIADNVLTGAPGEAALAVSGHNNRVERNLLKRAAGAPQPAFGLLIEGTRVSVEGNTVEGAYFGIAVQPGADHARIVGNTLAHNAGDGLLLGGNDAIVTNNTINANGLSGVHLTAGQRNMIRANALFSNTILGIDIEPGGQSGSSDALDLDSGPNGAQNAPLLVTASPAAGALTLDVALTSAANARYSIDVYASDVCNGGTAAGRLGGDFGEGQRFLGSFELSTDARGEAGSSLRLPFNAPVGVWLSATATDASGNTSEFSNCVEVLDTGLLAVYAFAFDNVPGTPGDLAVHYPVIERELIVASATRPGRVAIALRDFGGLDDNTSIVIINRGLSMTLSALPDAAGLLSQSIREYDMASGTQLGGFVRWARATHNATRVLFEFQGHGVAAAPSAQPDNGASAVVAQSVVENAARTDAAPGIAPLPSWIDMKSGYTDARSRTLLSVPALADALRSATDNGALPIDVLNIAHCFAATIEEFSEVAPFVRAIVGSPSYDYLLTAAPARIFAAVDPAASPQEMARVAVRETYAELPLWAHPGVYIAVDAAKLAPVKQHWDAVSTALISDFAVNPVATRAKILDAYRSSAKYDSASCRSDWLLQAPDAISDFGSFAQALAARYGSATAVGAAALRADAALNAALLEHAGRNGKPWFANPSDPWHAPEWVFGGSGIGLYTDFQGAQRGSDVVLSWQAPSYASAQPSFAFARRSTQAAAWGDVMAAYWQGRSVITEACGTPTALEVEITP